MTGARGVFDTIKEGLFKAFEDTTSHWLKGLDFKVGKFAEDVSVQVTAGLIVAMIVALIGVVMSRRIWTAVHRRWRAAIIRKIPTEAFVIVRCPILNDKDDAIGNEIAQRLETSFKVFAVSIS